MDQQMVYAQCILFVTKNKHLGIFSHDLLFMWLAVL